MPTVQLCIHNIGIQMSSRITSKCQWAEPRLGIMWYLSLKRSSAYFYKDCQQLQTLYPGIQCCLYLGRFFTSLQAPGATNLDMGSQLWLLVGVSHSDWSHNLLEPVTCPRRFLVWGPNGFTWTKADIQAGLCSTECRLDVEGTVTHRDQSDFSLIVRLVKDQRRPPW